MADVLSAPSSGSSGKKKDPNENLGAFADWGSPIPEGYGETRVALMPRDPFWMFSYWEITETTVREIKSKHGENIFNEAAATLRMHQVESRNGTVQTLRHMDVTVAFDARNWYLKADAEGSSWFVELGLKKPNGEFILISRSNFITLPKSRVSEITDEKWATIKEDMEKLLAASGGGKTGTGSFELGRALAQRWELLSQISSWKGSGRVSSFERPQPSTPEVQNPPKKV